MDRTYDTFVDNGLFVLAHYLGKDIKDITYKDIEDSLELMSNTVEDFLDCPKYSNLKTMFLFNSAVSNPSMKDVKLSTALQGFLDERGKDYCMSCGKNNANIYMKLKGRSYLPNRPSATYFNFSNNLHNINVCPYCLVLTTYSVMNSRVNETIYLYNTPDNEFMKSYTAKRQEENMKDLELKAHKSKTNTNRLDDFMKLLNKDANFESDIEIYRFSNGREENVPSTESIPLSTIRLLQKMDRVELLPEFKELGLTWMIVSNRLKSRYLVQIYDFDNEQLKCSSNLFNFLTEEVNALEDNIIDIVDDISDKLISSKLDINKLIQSFRNVTNSRSFEIALMKIIDIYLEKTGQALFTKEEFNTLINPRIFLSIRNMFIVNLINK